MVSQKLLLELRIILKEDYGVELKLEEVLDVALVLIGFAETAMKIEAKSSSAQLKTETNKCKLLYLTEYL